MAKAELSYRLDERIRVSLDAARRSWAGLPAIEAEWAAWEQEQRIAFLEGWAVPRSNLEQLLDWQAEGQLDSDQARDLRNLLALIEANTPILDRLFAS